MTKEKSKEIFERFKFFHKPKCIGDFMSFGFEHDDGWFQLIWDLCEAIEKELTEGKVDLNPDLGAFDVLQVKEKFGSLRFYINWGTKAINDLIDAAEKKSEITCEKCGKSGIIRSGNWLRCLCDEHTMKRENEDA